MKHDLDDFSTFSQTLIRQSSQQIPVILATEHETLVFLQST